ncbi:MAG: cytochrome c biogenesis protein [Alphaproteobacteria bacterium]
MPKFFTLLLVSLLMIAPLKAIARDNTQSQETAQLDTSYMARLPILHDGRIKPLDSFARIYLKTFSGKETGAIAWLIEVLLDPARAEMRPVLKITNPEILTILHLERRKNKLYSYKEVSTALRTKQKMILSIINTDEKNWSTQQREFIELQKNMIVLQNLLGSLTLILPISTTLPDSLPEPFSEYAGRPLSFVETLNFQDDLQIAVKNIVAEKQHNVETYTADEQALAHLSFTLSLLSETGQKNDIFKVIPSTNDTWLSPWTSLSTPQIEQLKYWQELSNAYYNSDVEKWDDSAHKLYAQTTANNSNLRPNALLAEYYYNQYPPFFISFMICFVGLSVLITTLFYDTKIQRPVAFAALLGSFIFQLYGLSLRIYILDRPPVSTLYETVLFTGLVTTLYAVIVYGRNKKPMWLWLGLGLAVFLHILGFSHNTSGDSFVMLTAVLNTNFWLTTHVLCITAGYAFCALTSILAHAALIKPLISKESQIDSAIYKSTLTASLLALFFATIGTVLGGIWADQSWGRFWGWDPKENGALLIVLWLIWIIHGRISGQMNKHAVLCGLSFLSVILALSWFGVNLLGVGLHAYGFMDSAAWSLGIFITVEALFITTVTLALKKSKTKNA